MLNRVRSLFFLPSLALVGTVAVAALSGAPQQPTGQSADNIWQVTNQRPDGAVARDNVSGQFAIVTFNKAAFDAALAAVARDSEPAAAGVVMSLPMPDSTFQRFLVKESPILAPELSAAFPEIKTYSAQGIDDPTATARFGWTSAGFHSIHLSGETGSVYIDPYTPGDTGTYIVANKSSLQKPGESWICQVTGTHVEAAHRLENAFPISHGSSVRTYRLALAATAEYTALAPAAGANAAGSPGAAVARIVATMNRVNGIYERELSVRMTVATGPAGGDPTALIFTDAATDGYTNTSGGAMLTENQTKLDAVIGTANYDLGHVFSTGGGGVAFLGSPCSATQKAGGVTGSSNPTGDAFDVDYVAHEIGHQFGGNHTYNGAPPDASSCLTRAETAAYEPASGVTIQAYAGICGSQNIQRNSIDRFHVKSLDEMTAFLTEGGGNTCGTAGPANTNTPPVINGGSALTNHTIPLGTPFMLTANATDANNDSLTYAWEQYDLGAATTTVAAATSGATVGPLFRSYSATGDPRRMFPSAPYVLNHANVPPPTYTGTAFTGGPSCPAGDTCVTGETMPTTARTMNFQVTVRDNKSGNGAISTAAMTVTTAAESGPFAVTSNNAASSVTGNTQLTVTWDVVGTTVAPYNASNVSILVSLDGGANFTAAIASTPNDGSQAITVPNSPTSNARIMVKAVENIFFDVNNADIIITAGSGGAAAPAAPSAPTGTAGNGSVALSWSAPDNGGSAITGYQVQQSTNASSGFTNAAGCATNSTTTSCTVSQLTNGTPYFFKVAAINAVGTGTYSPASTAVTPVAPLGTVSVTPARLNFAAQKAGAGGALTSVTAAQTVTVGFSSGAPSWTVAVNQPWVSLSTTGGTGAGTFTVGISNPNNVLGASTNVSATVTLTAPGTSNTTRTITVNLAIDQSNGATVSAPFGQVDTPTQNATGVQGAIGVTGWVLDNIGVTGVKIYRNCLSFDNPASCQVILGHNVVEVGDAAFLAGARTDVEAAFGTHPQNNRAGWGYLMLTSMLPHVPTQAQYGGQGALTLYAVATDVEGNRKVLGRSSDPASAEFATPTAITMANDSIAKPFGAIDTPGQGQTVSGLLNNFGWALTADGNTTGGETGDILIPTNGSTMTVFIDSLPVALVAYNQCRGNVGNPVPTGVFCNDDVSNIFGNVTPQPVLTARTSNPTRHRNLDAGRAPIGVYSFNTATLSNGLHTIAWSVSDSAGRNEGIGSRFFNVLNSGADQSMRAAEVRGLAVMLDGHGAGVDGVSGRTGFDLSAAWVSMRTDEANGYRVRLPEQGRLELWLGDGVDAGYLVAQDGTLRDLPTGSSLSGAHFGWMPPVGYAGAYHLAFLRGGERIDVHVTVWPVQPAAEGESEIRMHLDPVSAQCLIGSLPHCPIVVEGWAFDPQAAIGSGIGTVHVWARSLVQGPGSTVQGPVFIGEATVNTDRPDVARAFDAAPVDAGYRLTTTMAPGTYEITVYAWNMRTGRWEDARTITTIVR